MSDSQEQGRRPHGMTREQIDEVQARYGVGPHLAADLVVVSAHWWGDEPDLCVLLIERGSPPYQGFRALPGGFVDLDEDLEHAARRELMEETSIADLGNAIVEQLRTFGAPGRDPRSRVVSVVHLALVPWDTLVAPEAGDDAADARFMSLREGKVFGPDGGLLSLAFDHDDVIATAWARLGVLARFSSAPLVLLPDAFTPAQAEHLFGRLRGEAVAHEGAIPWLEGQGWIERVGQEGEPVRWGALVRGTRWMR